MKPNQWYTVATFQTLALPDRLELLLIQRESLFRHQFELLQRLAVLACLQDELLERPVEFKQQVDLFRARLR